MGLQLFAKTIKRLSGTWGQEMQRHVAVEIELDGVITVKRLPMKRTDNISQDTNTVRKYFTGLGYKVGYIKFV